MKIDNNSFNKIWGFGDIGSKIYDNLYIENQKITDKNEQKNLSHSINPIDKLDIRITATKIDNFSNEIKGVNLKIGMIDTAIDAIKNQKSIIKELREELKNLPNLLSKEEERSFKHTIDEALKEIKKISKNTTFNGINILDRGGFGAYVDSSNSAFEISNPKITIENSGKAVTEVIEPPLQFFKNRTYGSVALKADGLEGVNIKIGTGYKEGFGEIAKALNSSKDISGVSANAEVIYRAFDGIVPIKEGKTPKEFFINGEKVRPTKVEAGDRDGKLAESIDKISHKTGVKSAIKSDGVFSLESDGRVIEIDGDLKELGKLNIIDSSLIPIPDVKANATFTPGDTLPEYIYKLNEPVIIKSLKVTELDGDFGLYNVYIQDRSKKKNLIRVGENIESSGNNVYKTNKIEIDGKKEGDTIIIKPLDENGKEGSSNGLGGWWYLSGVDVEAEYDIAFIEIGKLEIQKSGFFNMLDSKDLPYIYKRSSTSFGLDDLNEIDLGRERESVFRLLDDSIYGFELKLDSLKIDKQILSAKKEVENIESFVANSENNTYKDRDRVYEILIESASSFVDAQKLRSKDMVARLLFDNIEFSFNQTLMR